MIPPARSPGQPLTCTVCDATIAWPQPAGRAAPLCDAALCRMVMGQQATMAPQAFAFHLQYHVRRLRSRREALAHKAQCEGEENAQHWATLQAHAGSAAGPRALLVLPSGPRREQRLTQRRRRALRAHLYRVLREARAMNAQAVPAAAQPPGDVIDALAPLRGRVCAACAGGCCAAGGDTAYLTAATMQRVMVQHPDLTPRRLAAAYLARLGEQTLAGSCINHTRDGCSLPREWRSDTCNRYLCEAQKELGAQAADAAAPLQALVIVRRQSQWTKGEPSLPNDVIGSACITATETRPLLALPELVSADVLSPGRSVGRVVSRGAAPGAPRPLPATPAR